MPKIKHYKYYLILSKSKSYVYGAFAFNKEGKRAAKEYIAKLEKKTHEKFRIVKK